MAENDTISGGRSPRWFNRCAVGLTLCLFVGMMLGDWLFPNVFSRQLAKDGAVGGTGAFEHLTWVVLIPGILAGLFAYFRWRHRLPHPALGCWLLLWSLACIYFAGEEASWGQWYFRWRTPDVISVVNDQAETNLHNMSSWLDQKPRALVEVFIVLAGVLIPLGRLWTRRMTVLRGDLASRCEPWMAAPVALLPAGLLFAVMKICSWLPAAVVRDLGSSELHEFVIAWFLAWYLISYWGRLAPRSGGG